METACGGPGPPGPQRGQASMGGHCFERLRGRQDAQQLQRPHSLTGNRRPSLPWAESFGIAAKAERSRECFDDRRPPTADRSCATGHRPGEKGQGHALVLSTGAKHPGDAFEQLQCRVTTAGERDPQRSTVSARKGHAYGMRLACQGKKSKSHGSGLLRIDSHLNSRPAFCKWFSIAIVVAN